MQKKIEGNPLDPEKAAKDQIEEGAAVIGGCCRTSIEHIKVIKKIVDGI